MTPNRALTPEELAEIEGRIKAIKQFNASDWVRDLYHDAVLLLSHARALAAAPVLTKAERDFVEAARESGTINEKALAAIIDRLKAGTAPAPVTVTELAAAIDVEAFDPDSKITSRRIRIEVALEIAERVHKLLERKSPSPPTASEDQWKPIAEYKALEADRDMWMEIVGACAVEKPGDEKIDVTDVCRRLRAGLAAQVKQ